MAQPLVIAPCLVRPRPGTRRRAARPGGQCDQPILDWLCGNEERLSPLRQGCRVNAAVSSAWMARAGKMPPAEIDDGEGSWAGSMARALWRTGAPSWEWPVGASTWRRPAEPWMALGSASPGERAGSVGFVRTGGSGWVQWGQTDMAGVVHQGLQLPATLGAHS